MYILYIIRYQINSKVAHFIYNHLSIERYNDQSCELYKLVCLVYIVYLHYINEWIIYYIIKLLILYISLYNRCQYRLKTWGLYYVKVLFYSKTRVSRLLSKPGKTTWLFYRGVDSRVTYNRQCFCFNSLHRVFIYLYSVWYLSHIMCRA